MAKNIAKTARKSKKKQQEDNLFVLILYFRKAPHMHRPQMSHIFYFCEKV